jgi:AraC family transcriptional regulator
MRSALSNSLTGVVQPVMAFAARHLQDDLALRSLAARAGLSRYHWHRLFCARTGETPKQFTLRLRLDLATVMLLSGRESILNVALACGFGSHEAFCRAFRRRFGMTPGSYRKRGFVTRVSAGQVREHAALVARIGPCVGLYRIQEAPQRDKMTYSIAKRELAPQPVLMARRKVRRSEIASTIAEVLPQIFHFAQQSGLAIAGQPFTRYLESGPGLLTIAPGMPVAALAATATNENGIIADTLPDGPAAVTTHYGPYEKLPDAYAAIEEWMDKEGLGAAGTPWEVYVTDPADYPDPKDWRTDIFWPLTTTRTV